MDTVNIKKLRRKQLAAVNCLVILYSLALFFIDYFFQLHFSSLFLLLGIALLLHSIVGWLKGDSVKRIIPIFEKVAIYEKENMGKEWVKEQKVNQLTRLILSFLLFIQYLFYQTTGIHAAEINLPFLVNAFIVILLLVNGALIFRFRKMDRYP